MSKKNDLVITEWVLSPMEGDTYNDRNYDIWTRMVKYPDNYYSTEYLLTRSGFDPNTNKSMDPLKWENIF